MCGTPPIDPGPTRGELDTGHGGWGTFNLEIDGANTRLANVAAGGALDFTFGDTVGVECAQGMTCPLQLQIGTNAAKLGCAFDGNAVGNQMNVAIAGSNSTTLSLTFPTAGSYSIMVDPASSSGGCGATWTNGQPTDPKEVIAYVCVTPP